MNHIKKAEFEVDSQGFYFSLNDIFNYSIPRIKHDPTSGAISAIVSAKT